MNMKTIAAFIAVAVFLGSCVSSGTMEGRLSKEDKDVTPVVFHYESDRTGSGGTMSAVLDGETYSGKYVQITSTTTEDSIAPIFHTWDPYWRSWGPFGSPWYDGGTFTTFRTNYSGKAVATLFGDAGKSMRCRFHLSDPPAGLRGGGIGQCELSSGGTIDVNF